MRTAFLFLTGISCILAQPVPDAFKQEVSRTYTRAQGLPADEINCVAANGADVYAGSSKGLARLQGAKWIRVEGFDADPVESCAAAGASLYFTCGRALHKLNDGKAERIAQLPEGRPRSLIAARGGILLATDRGLYASAGRNFVPLSLPESNDVRQIAASPAGEVAVAAGDGIFIQAKRGDPWKRMLPRQGERSWAPVDVRGVAYDSAGRLWFASPQGAARLDGSTWTLYTGLEGLPFDDFTTLTAGADGVVWFGTSRGAIRFDGKTWEYRQGRRWLPSDNVQSIAVTPSGVAWLATPQGIAAIEHKHWTLSAKARLFEEQIDRYNRRTEYGFVIPAVLEQPGDMSRSTLHDSDNDGLWTSMYGAGECFAWSATKDPAARQRATKAFEALRFLSLVTQGGEHPAPPGFPARSILPVSAPDPNLKDSAEHNLQMREHRDHLWKLLSPRWPKSADGKWYWKADTSSDELDGHYFFYARYYDLVAEAPEEKEAVRAVVRAITDHLIDHDFTLVDWDGAPTRWGHFGPATLNHGRITWAERGLNSLSILSYLKVAEHMTGDSKYRKAYDTLIREDSYDLNTMVPKISTGIGSGNQSDDEMAFMSFYNLISYETDADLLQKYAWALSSYWVLERPEMNPFFNFVAAARLKGRSFTDAFRQYDLTPKTDWLEDSVDTLRRLPLDRVNWAHTNSYRRDIVHIRAFYPDEDIANAGYRRNGKVIPADERFFEFWNHNPYRLNTGGDGRRLADGAVFLLPYYMGLYHGYLQHGEGRFTK